MIRSIIHALPATTTKEFWLRAILTNQLFSVFIAHQQYSFDSKEIKITLYKCNKVIKNEKKCRAAYCLKKNENKGDVELTLLQKSPNM